MIKINGQRLWQRLMDMATLGATPKGGVCRESLTDQDKAGRDLFIQWCTTAGCTIEIDRIGNIFAIRAGTETQEDPILVGSHLDSQPTGGKYDGVYGVLAGLELIETLNDHQIKTKHPIIVASWTNEEGSRFAPGLTGSAVHIGRTSLAEAYQIQDKKGKRLAEELKRIGYQGQLQPGSLQFHASFEVHIEQGPILEAEALDIGVVTAVQGTRWYDINLYGKETHAGTTPMEIRVDPVRAALPIVAGLYSIADQHLPDIRMTIGFLDASPGVKNTVPGLLKISIDNRHPDDRVLDQIKAEIQHLLEVHLKASPVRGEFLDVMQSPAVQFAPACIEAVAQASRKLGLKAKKMISGAGHDAALLSQVCPTSMIFIPCKDGLSHNELESALPKDVENGANVLLHAVLEADRLEFS